MASSRREAAIKRMEESTKPDIEAEGRKKMYEDWKDTYDEDVASMDWNGPSIVARYAARLFENRDVVRVLDVGAGTGLLGKELYALGFRIIDALDGSGPMLSLAKRKGVYHQFINEYITEQPVNVDGETYDAIATCGAFGNGHIHYSALKEFIRLVKHGGYIIMAAEIDCKNTFMEEFGSELDKFETSGKLKKSLIEHVNNFNNEEPGIVLVYEIF